MEILISFVLSILGSFLSIEDTWSQTGSDRSTIETAQVVRVIDGDTIVVTIDGREEVIRYIGIDTPERYDGGSPACFSQEATARNVELVNGATVTLRPDQEDRDKYGRLLRYVYLDETFINEQLILEGYATTLRIEPNTTQASSLYQAELEARSQSKGLWSECRGGEIVI